MSVFTDLVEDELASARQAHEPINTLHEGYAVILEELDEFKEIVWKRGAKQLRQPLLSELVQIAAMAARVAEDVVGVF